MNELFNQSAHQMAVTVEKAREYINDAKADNTKRAYRADWQDFVQWCHSNSICPLPAAPDSVCLYLTQLVASRKVSTVQRRVAALGQVHLAAGHPSPATHISVRSLMRGIRRKFGSMQNGKSPLLTEHIRRIVCSLPTTIAGIRDQALILIGFSGAFRRSELVGLNFEDIEFAEEGIVLTLKRSKTDQEGQGAKKGIPYGNFSDTCPVQALQNWLNVSNIKTGAIFRSIDRHGNISNIRLTDKAVSLIIKRIAKKVGLDPEKFAGHSLRSGLATQASISGASELEIMKQTGHSSIITLRRYIRDGNLFRQNAAAKIGL